MEDWLETVKQLLPRVVTSDYMAILEENAEALGFSRGCMMENAGSATARFIASKTNVKGKRFLILCGTGNNGGDGFVVARHLRNMGAHITVVLVGRPQDIRSIEARINWNLISHMDDVEKIIVSDSSETGIVKKLLEVCDYVVDSMLGTGFRGVLKEPFASIVRELNSSNRIVFAVDVPTGLGSESIRESLIVKASYTVTFHKVKDFLQKSQYAGEIATVDIGIPLEAELYTGPGDVRRVIKSRKKHSHKGDYGYVLVVGGSETFSGAPALAALSALRVGAGLSLVAAPESVAGSIRAMSPDLVVYELPGKYLSNEALPLLSEIMRKADSLVIGPGLGIRGETIETVKNLIEEARSKSLPTVVDADGFKSLKSSPELLKGTIATPHHGEFKYVFGKETKEKWFENLPTLIELSRKYEFTILLKGFETIITDSSRLKVNKHATPGLAVGGTGDVLSGIIATFLAWGNSGFTSAAAAAYVHGEAGLKAVEEKGFHITASDLVEKIPGVMKMFDKEE
ncbi:MAG: NAD(P)H-hydrate dehydratase [Candidatus Brockarchaeota archaeon]|nr:NAD(P)H-hydrate dehydratase [Candidatus Brockarchaeota archaeon]